MTDPPNLQTLLNPRSIAVIGSTSKKRRVGNIIFQNLQRSSLLLYPIHPTEKTVMGRPAYSTIAAQAIVLTARVLGLAGAGVLVAGLLLGRPGSEGLISSKWVSSLVVIMATISGMIFGSFYS
jgi:hypothetical protein